MVVNGCASFVALDTSLSAIFDGKVADGGYSL